jgi:hypothetical protein
MPFPKNTIVPKFANSNRDIVDTSVETEIPDYTANINGFVPFSNRIILKRDETTTNHPCPDDLAVGELVLNAITGNLYTKLVSGQVVYYPGILVCVGKEGVGSNTFGTAISVPETYVEDTFTVSLYGITLSTAKGNEIRFNPVSDITQGFPSSFSLLYSSDNTSYFEIGRITVVGDYINANFEFVYKDNENAKPLKGQFKIGLYDNKSLGFLKIEAI